MKRVSYNFFFALKMAKRKRCWACSSLDVIKWGKQSGKQRFKCKNCEILFSNNRPEQVFRNRFVWFKKWVLERQIYETLSRDSKLSVSTLQRTFKYYLEQAPKVKIIKRDRVNLRLDATYFKMFCVVVYQDDLDGHTQLLRFSDKEDYSEIREDLENLIRLGVKLESITTDGHKGILKAMKLGVPDVITQRCLVHIQRMCLIWLTRRPKHPAALELRKMVLDLMRINTHNDRIYWTQNFRQWYLFYKDYINEKVFKEQTDRYWYKHRLLRRSYYLINKALPNMFHYLNHPNIPRTTNGIEGYFSHLKNHLDLHRGLTTKNRINFIKWYVHFSNQKK